MHSLSPIVLVLLVAVLAVTACRSLRVPPMLGYLVVGFMAGPGVMSQWLDRINPGSIHVTVLIIAVYAGMRLLEGWGLWRARAWASWLGCIGSAAYLPLDIYALYHHPGWHTWALLIVNLVIVWVLWRDIRRRKRI